MFFSKPIVDWKHPVDHLIIKLLFKNNMPIYKYDGLFISMMGYFHMQLFLVECLCIVGLISQTIIPID